MQGSGEEGAGGRSYETQGGRWARGRARAWLGLLGAPRGRPRGRPMRGGGRPGSRAEAGSHTNRPLFTLEPWAGGRGGDEGGRTPF